MKTRLWYTLYVLTKFEAHRRVVRLSMVRLAQVMGSSQQTASRHLIDLENMGLIRRAASFRGVEIQLTGKGLEELNRVYLELKNVIEETPSGVEKSKKLKCLGDLKNCPTPKQKGCLWWSECCVESLGNRIR